MKKQNILRFLIHYVYGGKNNSLEMSLVKDRSSNTLLIEILREMAEMFGQNYHAIHVCVCSPYTFLCVVHMTFSKNEF